MRRSERISLDEPARLHPNEWSSLEVQVLDFSEQGFRARCDASILSGSRVTLEIPGLGPVDAQVSWRGRGEIGAKFILPVDLSRCGWTPVGTEKVLARLLVQRAEARKSGLYAQEQALRKKILGALPMRGLPDRDG